MPEKTISQLDAQGIAPDRNQVFDGSEDKLLEELAQFLYEVYRRKKQEGKL